ncbi:hypothetical protein, partial [Bradyrhizobium sp. Leo170]|uniref:hypothetical protein n=1 Tax=Bradyrhizobium sp. Leo170 TaxID=1571199 RepID=UPI001A92543F
GIFFARRLDEANHLGIAGEFFSSVIPGRPKDEPGIHPTAEHAVRWIPGSRYACPGMTARTMASGLELTFLAELSNP